MSPQQHQEPPGHGPPDVAVPSTDEPRWRAGAVAVHLGVSVSTLRSWDRRYGLGPTMRSVGQHRRYSSSDVARLEHMRRLVARGMAPIDACLWVRAGRNRAPETASGSDRPAGPQREVTDAWAVRAMLDAAYRLDSPAIAEALDRHLEERGVVSTWNDVCVPAIHEIDRRNADGACTDVEHLMSWTISAALQRVPQQPVEPGTRIILLACVEQEQHTMGLDALRAALAEAGAGVRMLGAATPTPALCAAIERTRPGAVVLWAQTPRTGRPLVLTRPAAALRSWGGVLLAAGPGWSGRHSPPNVSLVDTMPTALQQAMEATASPA